MTRSVTEDLDAKVSGAEGSAHGRFAALDGDADLLVRAALSSGQTGTVEVQARPNPSAEDQTEFHQRAQGEVSANLGPGDRWRGTDLHVTADVLGDSASTGLCVLSLEVQQPDPPHGRSSGARDTYSVEGRVDEHGRAHLEIVVRLG